MGEIVLAAKSTHVPSMLISEKPGPAHGCRSAAIDGLRELGRRARAAGADTVVVFDTHWLVNAGYHVNNNERHAGVYTSHEFPHFIQNLEYSYRGNVDLGRLIAKEATANGVKTLAHEVPTLTLEYGTLVPMHYMNSEADLRVVSVAAWCTFASLEESRKVGEGVARAIARSDSKVAIIASGSLSHQIWENHLVEQGMFTISRQFNKQIDLRVMDLWRQGAWKEFLAMLPDYAERCYGEGRMHDTAMLFGALGWDKYRGKGDVVCDYFESSGTGQCIVEFPVAGIPAATQAEDFLGAA
jgi:3,4-dihydroxyphenylacetate 2,3-dioxygenase